MKLDKVIIDWLLPLFAINGWYAVVLYNDNFGCLVSCNNLLLVVIHLSSNINKSEAFTLLNNISSYSVLSSSGESLVGSTTTPSVSLLLYNKHNTCGCFTNDSAPV